MNDGPCYYCGKSTNSLAANPSEWPIRLCHPDDPGKAKHHHTGCISDRLRALEVSKLQNWLLFNDVAFWGSDYEDTSDPDPKKWKFRGMEFCAICNDVFAWGTADCEPVLDLEVPILHKIYEKYGKTGIDAWCSLKRDKMEPQEPYIEMFPEFHKIRDEIATLIQQ
jgi:hypothetical protein